MLPRFKMGFRSLSGPLVHPERYTQSAKKAHRHQLSSRTQKDPLYLLLTAETPVLMRTRETEEKYTDEVLFKKRKMHIQNRRTCLSAGAPGRTIEGVKEEEYILEFFNRSITRNGCATFSHDRSAFGGFLLPDRRSPISRVQYISNNNNNND